MFGRAIPLLPVLVVGSALVAACAGGGGEPRPTSVAMAPSATEPASCVRGRTFIVLRHAEKATEISADDPPLTDQGKERARRLAMMLGHAGVTRLVASSYRRTQETLAPLAEQVGRSVEIRPMIDHEAELVADLRASPDGAVVAVASHSNVLPRVVRELGDVRDLRGVTGGSLPDTDYGRVYVITLACRARPSVLELSSEP